MPRRRSRRRRRPATPTPTSTIRLRPRPRTHRGRHTTEHAAWPGDASRAAVRGHDGGHRRTRGAQHRGHWHRVRQHRAGPHRRLGSRRAGLAAARHRVRQRGRVHRLHDWDPDADGTRRFDRHGRRLWWRFSAAHRVARRRRHVARRSCASSRRTLRHQRVGCRRNGRRSPIHAPRVPRGAVLASDSSDGGFEAGCARRPDRAEPVR